MLYPTIEADGHEIHDHDWQKLLQLFKVLVFQFYLF